MWKLGLALTLLSAAAADSRAGRPSPDHASTLALLYEDGRIYVPVRVGQAAARWFILDTGATQTLIDTAVAKAEGLSLAGDQMVTGAGSGSSRQAHTSAVELSVGLVPLRVAKPAVIDLAHLLGPTSGRAPAGIIGSQFFREHIVEIDFVRRRLNLYPPATERRQAYAAAIPLTFNDWTPLATVRLTDPSGRAVDAHALIDLGAKSTFLVAEPFVARKKLGAAFSRTVVTGLGAGVGGDTFYAFARASRVGFAAAPEIALDRPIIGMSVGGTLRGTWNDGLLGAEFLSRYRVAFDYRRHRMLISPRSATAEPFDRSGMFLAATAGDLKRVTVRAVLTGGPAEAAGLVAGDELLSIDAKPVAAIGLPALRHLLKAPSGSTVRIEFARNGMQRTAAVRLRDLL